MADFFRLPVSDIYSEFHLLILNCFTKPVMEESRTRMVNNDDAAGPVFTGKPD